LTTSKQRSLIQLALEYTERREAEMLLKGRRAIFMDTSELCTIEKAEILEHGIRYTVNMDKHPKTVKTVIWDALVIIGEVQAHGNRNLSGMQADN